MDCSHPKLFSPIRVGPMSLSHRFVLTDDLQISPDRPFGLDEGDYGRHAASGGLIIHDAATVASTPSSRLEGSGIFADEQRARWRMLTGSIRANGGRIFLRISQPISEFDRSSKPNAPTARPSLIPFLGQVFASRGWITDSGRRPPRQKEISAIIEWYRSGAKEARAAGFDGVEIDATEGCLLGQILQIQSRRPRDEGGGTVEDQHRILFEILQAVSCIWGRGRVGVRLSLPHPNDKRSDFDSNALFAHIAQRLNAFGAAYLHWEDLRPGRNEFTSFDALAVKAAGIRKFFAGPIIVPSFDADIAEALLVMGNADLVAFCRPSIATLSSSERGRLGLPQQEPADSPFHDARAAATSLPRSESSRAT